MFVLIDSIPPNARLLNHRIIAEGEATGHVHEAVGPDCQLYEESGMKYLEAKTETPITHTEHKPVILPPGVYKVIRQKEYVPRRRRARWRTVPD